MRAYTRGDRGSLARRPTSRLPPPTHLARPAARGTRATRFQGAARRARARACHAAPAHTPYPSPLARVRPCAPPQRAGRAAAEAAGAGEGGTGGRGCVSAWGQGGGSVNAGGRAGAGADRRQAGAPSPPASARPPVPPLTTLAPRSALTSKNPAKHESRFTPTAHAASSAPPGRVGLVLQILEFAYCLLSCGAFLRVSESAAPWPRQFWRSCPRAWRRSSL